MRVVIFNVEIYGKKAYWMPTCLESLHIYSPDTVPYVVEEIGNLANSAIEFAKIYKHLSPNGEIFELFCFQRWFYLREIMALERLDKVWMIDSDILTVNRLPEDMVGFSGGHGCIGFDDVSKLCDLFMSVFGREMSEVVKWRDGHLPGEHLSDMTMISKTLPGLPYTFSYNICLSHGYEMDGDHVRLWAKNGELLVRNVEGGEFVRMNTLHFWKYKKRMAHVLKVLKTSGERLEGIKI